MVETASKLVHNWRRYPSSNCHKIDKNMRFWIWRSAVAQSDTAENNCNMGAQLVPRVHNSPKDIWENLLPV